MSLQTFFGNHFWFFIFSPLLGAGSPNSSAGRQQPLGGEPGLNKSLINQGAAEPSFYIYLLR